MALSVPADLFDSFSSYLLMEGNIDSPPRVMWLLIYSKQKNEPGNSPLMGILLEGDEDYMKYHSYTPLYLTRLYFSC